MAIHRDQIHVVYQPQYDLERGVRVGLEALARWRHPVRGDIPPSVFVPLAEQMGLIGELDTLVLRRAAADIGALRRAPAFRQCRVSVNVSAGELRNVEYPPIVTNALEAAQLPASALCLEVTESVALDDSPDYLARLSCLAEMGVRLSIDDFGTGHSSYAGLTAAPWTEIKVDRSLTCQCDSAQGREMLRSIFMLGDALPVDIVAEGIETLEQAHALRALGCTIGQGYFLGRPLPIGPLIAADGTRLDSLCTALQPA